LPVVKKTKTGPSTDVDVLMELASQHPLPAKIIEYRQASKLKGTYVDALQSLVSSKSGRVHTSFRQDAAITGRLSSNEPNLQNIPVRTEDGRKIRSAFVPGPPGWVLLAADYSQIELRVLAHFCGDISLRTAFEADQDIHARVASEVYGVPLDEVTSAMRRSAKAVNFGIIYGQSPFGLAKGLNISKDEASEFIDNYFARYSGVQTFIADTLRNCRNQGFVSTMLGRKRWIKGVRDFDSMDANKRKILIEPERMAVNTIIQGTAADIIKKAMIDVYRTLRTSNLQAKMLLQIHDELLFEVAETDVDELAALVRDKMTNVVKLAVPLKVDVKVGRSWAECEPI
jgi:DNA polymerase I